MTQSKCSFVCFISMTIASLWTLAACASNCPVAVEPPTTERCGPGKVMAIEGTEGAEHQMCLKQCPSNEYKRGIYVIHSETCVPPASSVAVATPPAHVPTTDLGTSDPPNGGAARVEEWPFTESELNLNRMLRFFSEVDAIRPRSADMLEMTNRGTEAIERVKSLVVMPVITMDLVFTPGSRAFENFSPVMRDKSHGARDIVVSELITAIRTIQVLTGLITKNPAYAVKIKSTGNEWVDKLSRLRTGG
jgi:hypothetical protein